jgi:hypothetical protein
VGVSGEFTGRGKRKERVLDTKEDLSANAYVHVKIAY